MRTTTMLGAPGLAAAVLIGLSGCAAGSAAPTTSPAPPVVTDTDIGTSSVPPSPTTSPPATVDPTEAEILRVYAEFMDARNVSLNDPRKAPDRRLFKVSVPPARDELYQLVLYYRSKGIAVRGAEVSSPTRVQVARESATVLDCVDGSAAVPVLIETGKSVIAPSQPPRLQVSSTLTRKRGSWLVETWKLERSKPC